MVEGFCVPARIPALTRIEAGSRIDVRTPAWHDSPYRGGARRDRWLPIAGNEVLENL